MNKKAKQDIFVCLVIYAFMLFCFVQTFSMKSGSATMPRLILSLAFICNTALTVRTIGQLKKNPGGEGYTSISEIKVPMLMFLDLQLHELFCRNGHYDPRVHAGGKGPPGLEGRADRRGVSRFHLCSIRQGTSGTAAEVKEVRRYVQFDGTGRGDAQPA